VTLLLNPSGAVGNGLDAGLYNRRGWFRRRDKSVVLARIWGACDSNRGAVAKRSSGEHHSAVAQLICSPNTKVSAWMVRCIDTFVFLLWNGPSSLERTPATSRRERQRAGIVNFIYNP
jgi:hypothetical protein